MKLPTAKWFRALIYLPAKAYELAVRTRVVLYEQAYLKSKEITGAAVISVGNLSLGGTGKTPLVEYIAQFLAAEQFEVAILSRGYRRRDNSRKMVVVSDGKTVNATLAEAGDEPFMLAQRLKGTSVIVGANRYQSGCHAHQELGCEILLLDDGFQHLSLKRDLDIVVLDGTDPFGGGEMVPFGRLREPLYGLRRAQAIIVTRADYAIDQQQIDHILKGLDLDLPVIYAYHDLVGLRELSTNQVAPLRLLNNAPIALLCALGNPQIFINDLLGYQAELVYQQLFSDHHDYVQTDIDQVVAAARNAGAKFIVTTAKDAVKLQGLNSALPIYIAELKVQFEDEVKLKSILLRTIMRKRELINQRR